jgi:hypothetical protein
VRQTGLLGSFIGYLRVPAVTGVFSGHKFVRPAQKSAFLRVNFMWLLRVPR